jgi:Clostripain family
MTSVPLRERTIGAGAVAANRRCDQTSTRHAMGRAALVVAAALVGSSCSGSKPVEREDARQATSSSTVAPAISPPTSIAATTPKKLWTVLVYSIADTDLEPSMMDDVTEMGQVGTGANLNIVALVDRAKDYSDDPVLDLGNWVGGKLIEIGQGKGKVLRDYGDLNTGDPQVLADFVAQGIQQYPADNYALIISDHGASWPGVGGDESFDSDALSLQEIHEGVAAGLKAAGVPKLSMLGFDACLMATYEVATDLAPVANRLIASQEVEPGHGWDYNSLRVLESATPVDVDTLGSQILDGYRAQAKAEKNDADITLALLDLTKIKPLDDAVNQFARVLAGRAADLGPKVGRVRSKTYAYGRSPDSDEDTQMVDLGDLVSRIGVEALDVSPQSDAVLRAQNDVVVRSIEGIAAIKSTGMSVYFPANKKLYDANYASVVGDSPWLSFIAAYFGAGEAIPAERRPRFKTRGPGVTETATVEAVTGKVTINAALEPDTAANIADTVIRYGLVGATGAITYLGEEFGTAASDGTGSVSGDFDLTTLRIGDGTLTVNAYAMLDANAENGIDTLDIPMAYFAPGRTSGSQDVVLSLTFDTTTDTVLEETYYAFNDKLGTYGELFIQPGGTLAPQLLQVAADGTETWTPSADRLNANPSVLSYGYVRLATGTKLLIELTVTDFGGNQATTSATVTVV